MPNNERKTDISSASVSGDGGGCGEIKKTMTKTKKKKQSFIEPHCYSSKSYSVNINGNFLGTTHLPILTLIISTPLSVCLHRLTLPIHIKEKETHIDTSILPIEL